MLSGCIQARKIRLREDDQSIMIETSSCNLQFFSELITTHIRFEALHGGTRYRLGLR